jgi:hypothetical protein
MGRWEVLRAGQRIEVYDLQDDSAEKTNMADKQPAVVTKALDFLKNVRTPSKEWRSPLD